jgi:putative hydroxymethylpyrimidine transport system permease protein
MVTVTAGRTTVEEILPTKASRKPLFGVVNDYGPTAALLVCGVLLWQFIFTVAHVPSYLVPRPSDIADAFATNRTILESATWATLSETGLGVVAALVAGIGSAIVLHLVPLFRRVVYPLLIGSQTVPIIVVGPILVILLGYNIYPKIIIVALVCFFPLVVATLDGLDSVTGDYVDMMRSLDASRMATFWRIELPSSLPMMFSGIRIAVTYAAIGAVVAEWSGSTNGLGYVMQEAEPELLTSRIFAVILILTTISILLFTIVSILQRVLVPWAPSRAKPRARTPS